MTNIAPAISNKALTILYSLKLCLKNIAAKIIVLKGAINIKTIASPSGIKVTLLTEQITIKPPQIPWKMTNNLILVEFSPIVGNTEYPLDMRSKVKNRTCILPLTSIISEKSNFIHCIMQLLSVNMTPDKLARKIPRIWNLCINNLSLILINVFDMKHLSGDPAISKVLVLGILCCHLLLQGNKKVWKTRRERLCGGQDLPLPLLWQG